MSKGVFGDWEIIDRGVLGIVARNMKTGQLLSGDVVNDIMAGGPVKRLAKLAGIKTQLSTPNLIHDVGVKMAMLRRRITGPTGRSLRRKR